MFNLSRTRRSQEVHLRTIFNTKYTKSYLVSRPDNFTNIQHTTSYTHTLLHKILSIAAQADI